MEKIKNLAMVHAIATDKEVIAPVGPNYIWGLSYLGPNYIWGLSYYERTNSWGYERYFDGMKVPNPHYLYFTIDEAPKEKEWCIWGQRMLKQFSGSSNSLMWKKIIATTNPELWTRRETELQNSNWPGTPKEIKGVAKIDTDFIEAFVKENGNIKEVLVGYVSNAKNAMWHVHTEMQEMYWKCDTCGKSWGYSSESKCECAKTYVLDLNSHGAVKVYRKEEKMYTREQVLDILRSRHIHIHSCLINDETIEGKCIPIEEWFDENYPGQ